MITRNDWEPAPEFPEDAYAVAGWGAGIAFYVLGWETEPTEGTIWFPTGYEERTGRLVVRMIGDDRNFSVDPEDVEALDPESFCRDCGQVGCGHNVYS